MLPERASESDRGRPARGNPQPWRDPREAVTLAQCDHRPLVVAIGCRDPDAAYAAMRSHLLNTGRLLIEQDQLVRDDDAPIAWRELVEAEPRPQ